MIRNREARDLIPKSKLDCLDVLKQGEGGEFSIMTAPGWAMVISPGVRLEPWTKEEEAEIWLPDEMTWDHLKVLELLKRKHPQITHIDTYVREEGD